MDEIMDELDAIERITKECHNGDPEADHSRADNILCEFLRVKGHESLAAAWDAVEKWYA